jgi:hypothetical protein
MDRAEKSYASTKSETVTVSHAGFTEVLKRESKGKRRLSLVSHSSDPNKDRARILADEILSSASTLDRSPGAYFRLEVLDDHFLRLTLSASNSHASAVVVRSASDKALQMACRQLLLTDAGRLEEALAVAADRLAIG